MVIEIYTIAFGFQNNTGFIGHKLWNRLYYFVYFIDVDVSQNTTVQWTWNYSYP